MRIQDDRCVRSAGPL